MFKMLAIRLKKRTLLLAHRLNKRHNCAFILHPIFKPTFPLFVPLHLIQTLTETEPAEIDPS